jgi:hypothetical protein
MDALAIQAASSDDGDTRTERGSFAAWKVRNEELKAKYDALSAAIQQRDALYANAAATEDLEGVAVKALDRKIDALENSFGTFASDTSLLWKTSYLANAVKPAGTILRIRLWFEKLLPIVFGAMAIILALLAHGSA